MGNFVNALHSQMAIRSSGTGPLEIYSKSRLLVEVNSLVKYVSGENVSKFQIIGNQVWLLVLSLYSLACMRQTGHLMHEVSAECMNEGCRSHKCKIVQGERVSKLDSFSNSKMSWKMRRNKTKCVKMISSHEKTLGRLSMPII